MLLVSDLYAQGAPLSDVRNRLITLGYQNPSVAVLAVADELAASHDQVKQQEANQLHEFAAALVAASGDQQTTAAATVQPVPAAATVQPIPTATTVVMPAAPVAQATSEPTAAAPVVNSAPANPSVQLSPSVPVATNAPPSTANSVAPAVKPAPTANPAVSVGSSAPPPGASSAQRTAVIHTSDRSPAILRRDPTSKSSALAIVPFGAKVVVLGEVQGEAIDPAESRWYHISYNGHDGYVYFKLVQVGG